MGIVAEVGSQIFVTAETIWPTRGQGTDSCTSYRCRHTLGHAFTTASADAKERLSPLEPYPFKDVPPEQAKAAFFEYCVAKYSPKYADWDVLNAVLLKFADRVFEYSKSQSNPEGYVYEMIYRETLDWQKFLAEALSNRVKA